MYKDTFFMHSRQMCICFSAYFKKTSSSFSNTSYKTCQLSYKKNKKMRTFFRFVTINRRRCLHLYLTDYISIQKLIHQPFFPQDFHHPHFSLIRIFHLFAQAHHFFFHFTDYRFIFFLPVSIMVFFRIFL